LLVDAQVSCKFTATQGVLKTWNPESPTQ